MTKIKKIFRETWTLIRVLWRKYILRRKPAVTVNEKGETVTMLLMKNYESMQKLVDAGLVEFDLGQARLFMSWTAYQAFMCDGKGEADAGKAAAFLENALFYVNFNRNYARGLMEQEAEADASGTEAGREDVPEWIKQEAKELSFVVAIDDEGTEVYKTGWYKDGIVESKVLDLEKHPVEAAKERMRNIMHTLSVAEKHNER